MSNFIVYDDDSESVKKKAEEQIRQINEAVRLSEKYSILNREKKEKEGVRINLSYPYSKEYEYRTTLERIDLDKEREKDILTNKGFIISEYQPIQKEIKAEQGIFSPKFGQTLSDTNPFIDRYKCKCGRTRSRLYDGINCPYCGTPVQYVDDDYSYFGWLVLQDHYLIHPNLYKSIEFLCGSQRLINILELDEEVDSDGHKIDNSKEEKKKQSRKGPRRKERKKNEPFWGKGMIWFRNHFQEVCDYYLATASNKVIKQPYYDDIMAHKDIIFCQSIPVYTTHLRPFDINGKKKFSFEGTNADYNIMSKLVTELNSKKNLKMTRTHTKSTDSYLFVLQTKWNHLYTEIDNILSGKKGNVRLLAGGRFNFSSRDVIVQNPNLRLDQVTLPYYCLVDLLQQQIINILTMTYNMSYSNAHLKWYKSRIEIDNIIVEIINGLIKSSCGGKGLPVIINRNPSIARGSLLQMHCIGMTFDYTMALPLRILPLLAADFDGDVLNVYYIINKAFYERSYEVMNPKNSMCISNNDGLLNRDIMPAKDTLINANTLVNLGRDKYSKEQMEKIQYVLNLNRA